MLSCESTRVFQDKYNSPESLEDYKKHERLQEVCKTMKSLEDYKSQEVHKSQEVCKSQRRLPCLEKPEPQESGRLADQKSQEAEE
jgi:single-stranded DNA-binding protein